MSGSPSMPVTSHWTPTRPTDDSLCLRTTGSDAGEEDQSVGVYLDRPAGSLSFYRVSPGGGGSSDTLTHLHTFCSSFTQEDLLPGVAVGIRLGSPGRRSWALGTLTLHRDAEPGLSVSV
ncbi:unnamed protein product [Gadus morhua 'NCC']